MKKNLIIVGAVVGLAILFGAIFFMTQGKKPKNLLNTANKDKTPTTQEAPKAAQVNVCEVLTLDVAETIFKGKAKLATGGSSSGSCTYTSGEENPKTLQVITMLVTSFSAAEARTSFESAKNLAYENKIEPVTGLDADGAYYATNLNQLSILKGGHWIIITVYSGAYPSDKEASIATANLVLGKIK